MIASAIPLPFSVVLVALLAIVGLIIFLAAYGDSR